MGKTLLARLEPLHSGRDTEIDMIEREMEGGVVIIQPLDVHQSYSEEGAGGLFGIKTDIQVHEFEPKPRVEPTE